MAASNADRVYVSAFLCCVWHDRQPQGEIEWIIEGSVTQLLKEAHREKIRTAFDLEFKNHLQTCLDNLEANKMLADALHGKVRISLPKVCYALPPPQPFPDVSALLES